MEHKELLEREEKIEETFHLVERKDNKMNNRKDKVKAIPAAWTSEQQRGQRNKKCTKSNSRKIPRPKAYDLLD